MSFESEVRSGGCRKSGELRIRALAHVDSFEQPGAYRHRRGRYRAGARLVQHDARRLAEHLAAADAAARTASIHSHHRDHGDDLDDVPAIGKKMAKPNGDHRVVTEHGKWKEGVQAYLASIRFTDTEAIR